jgi:hypothetical protein
MSGMLLCRCAVWYIVIAIFCSQDEGNKFILKRHVSTKLQMEYPEDGGRRYVRNTAAGLTGYVWLENELGAADNKMCPA